MLHHPSDDDIAPPSAIRRDESDGARLADGLFERRSRRRNNWRTRGRVRHGNVDWVEGWNVDTGSHGVGERSVVR